MMINHIRENAVAKQIYIDTLNGAQEHLYCLLDLDADRSISKVMQLIKGQSAHWANSQAWAKNKFGWADEYFAVSISESMLDRVRDYIRNQQEHH